MDWEGKRCVLRWDVAYESIISQVPIMLRSSFCILHELSDKDLHELNECPYDQV